MEEASRNGATWIRDCLIDGAAIARAFDRLQAQCCTGVRHFSAIGIAVSLDQVKSVESELLRLDAELDSMSTKPFGKDCVP